MSRPGHPGDQSALPVCTLRTPDHVCHPLSALWTEVSLAA